MRTAKLVLGLGMIFILTNGLSGQDDQATEQPKIDSMEQTIEIFSMIMTKTFEKAELTEAQLSKVIEIIDRRVPDMVRTRAVHDSILTPEQKKKYAAALKLARKANYETAEQEGYALRKLKLSEEVLAKYKETKKKAEDINTGMNDEIASLLTEEQKNRLPKMFQSQQTNLKEYRISFPKMKTKEDSEVVWKQISEAVKGAVDFAPNLTTQTVIFKVPAAVDINKELEKLAASAGSEIMADWKKMPEITVRPRPIKRPSGADKSPADSGTKGN